MEMAFALEESHQRFVPAIPATHTIIQSYPYCKVPRGVYKLGLVAKRRFYLQIPRPLREQSGISGGVPFNARSRPQIPPRQVCCETLCLYHHKRSVSPVMVIAACTRCHRLDSCAVRSECPSGLSREMRRRLRGRDSMHRRARPLG
jgi:hypothetical protein